MPLPDDIRALATELGFTAAGIASVEPFYDTEAAFIHRIRQGLFKGLGWITEERAQLSCNPQRLLPTARSIISLAISYKTAVNHEHPRPGALAGRISRYARGQDYHPVIKAKLKAFAERLGKLSPMPLQTRVFVDTGPIAERAVAQRAGVGWFGKNTCILTREHGSWVFLAEILTNLELEPDLPLRKSCGRCEVCISSCPTGALKPYDLHSDRCISYLTIENRGAIPRELRPLMGDWIFGCDICQDVCPVNRRARDTEALELPSPEPSADLLALLDMTEEKFKVMFAKSAIKRARRAGLLRNVCVALGNIGDASALPALARALKDESTLVRGHAAWALGRIKGKSARWELENALSKETDPRVLDEIRAALSE